MTTANFQSFRVSWDQSTGNTCGCLTFQQPFRIFQLKCQSDNRCHRCESDIALIKIKTHAQNFFSFPFTTANDAGIGNGAGIGTCFRAGKCKTGNFFSVSQPGQIIILLFFSAVMLQQFAWTKRIRNAYRTG